MAQSRHGINMAVVMYINPPDGWKYGFPKIVPEEHKNRLVEWLIEQGYPQEEIDSRGEHFYSRFWYQEEGVDEQRL